MDIPEFFALGEELFSPQEAEINNAMPRRSWGQVINLRVLMNQLNLYAGPVISLFQIS